MNDIEKVVKDLESIKALGTDGSPAHIKIDNAIQTIRELQKDCNRYHEWGMHEGYEEGYAKGGSDMEKAKQIIIDNLLEKIPKWHLVSEGDLPTDENDYLLYFKEGNSVLGWYSRPNKQWTNSSSGYSIIAEVIAWMELPKFSEV